MALTVVLTPGKQSTATLDKNFEEYRRYMEAQLADVKFGEIQRGRFNGVEARAGEYFGIRNGKQLTSLYLCGIDSKGMFWLIAPLQKAVATLEIIQEIKTSMLTFKRAK
jgi:hypothetical protein